MAQVPHNSIFAIAILLCACHSLHLRDLPIYQESRFVVVLETPIRAPSLSGRVVDAQGISLPLALAERVDPKDSKRLDAAATNAGGRFRLKAAPGEIHLLRVSRAGFDTVLVQVIVDRSAKSELRVSLELST